jgi:hypothetical protein
MEEDYKRGFMDKAASYGLNKEAAEGLYKEAFLASLLRAGGRGLQRSGDYITQQAAKGVSRFAPGTAGKINRKFSPNVPTTSTGLVPYGTRGGVGGVGGLVGDLAAGKLFMRPDIAKAIGATGLLGAGWGLNKLLFGGGQAQPQHYISPYGGPGWQPMANYQTPPGMGGVLPYMT